MIFVYVSNRSIYFFRSAAGSVAVSLAVASEADAAAVVDDEDDVVVTAASEALCQPATPHGLR